MDVILKPYRLIATLLLVIALAPSAFAQSNLEDQLCEAARTKRVIEIVYDNDSAKGCLPRLLDVHQIGVGKNGKIYLHGWQTRGCTKGRDYAAERIFRFDKIKSVKIIDGEFGTKSQSVKDGGWDGCIGSNCFIKENICE